MAFSPTSSDRLLSIYVALGQYPILGSKIRARMRLTLFSRGIISELEFENEVRQKAVDSQAQEGLTQPYASESGEIWDLRLNRVRDMLTDLHFSQHLPYNLFEQIVRDVLRERGVSPHERVLTINPELAPQELVFEQALMIENMPALERGKLEARLQEAKVVLIRTLISDQLRYINVAKDWFTVTDLAEIRRRKIGAGRIGGKAAGMLLAARILAQSADMPMRACLQTPESYFLGADELYTFMSINNLVHWNDQKYKSEEEMRAEYPLIERDFLAGVFQPDIVQQLQAMLSSVGNQPVIVRSSSLLEDNFGTAFAGKYESIFCPNQSSPADNLRALTQAIAKIYASTLNPSALLYRRSRGLQDYDERMALLIQVVRGERYGDYFMPHAAGVAFSRNLYRWAPQIKREDGFVRLVWGLGTRAVDRVGNDYPRLIALSHPLLRPNTNPKTIARYSQQYVDLIDLKENVFKTLPAHDVLDGRYPPLRYIAQVMEEDGYLTSMRSNILHADPRNLVLTFDELLRRTNFAEVMRQMLAILERSYRAPVDMEFCVELDPSNARGESYHFCIDILQCRPQSRLQDTEEAPLPVNLLPEDVIFSTSFIVPQGLIERLDTFVYVPEQAYFSLPTNGARVELARLIGTINHELRDKNFMCVGPGRWGSSNADLGVPIEYGDIYNTRALLEVTGDDTGVAPEPSLGTHFFQDLLEAQIYPLALSLDDPHSVFNRQFFCDLPNHLREVAPVSAEMEKYLRVVRVEDYRPGTHVRVVMNDERGVAIGYLEKNSDAPAEKKEDRPGARFDAPENEG